MADLRAKFLEDYAGGFLNISRQELSSTGEVLSHDGFLDDKTIFVEDGIGVKSGLKLGIGLAEVVDPTTQLGVVNVRYADRTYTKIKDAKVFLTAIASSQAALSDAITNSISNIENAIETLDISNMNLDRRLTSLNESFLQYENDSLIKINNLTQSLREINENLDKMNISVLGENIIIGELSLNKLMRGTANVVIGYASLLELSNGSENISLGNNIGNLQRGNNNIYLGHAIEASKERINNEIIIGNKFHDYIKLSCDYYVPAPDEKIADISNEQCYNFIQTLMPIKALNVNEYEDYLFDIESIKLAQNELGFGNILGANNSISKTKIIPFLVGAIKYQEEIISNLGENTPLSQSIVTDDMPFNRTDGTDLKTGDMWWNNNSKELYIFTKIGNNEGEWAKILPVE